MIEYEMKTKKEQKTKEESNHLLVDSLASKVSDVALHVQFTSCDFEKREERSCT